MNIRRWLLLSLLPAVALAQGARKEVGALIIDGIPDVPAETLERLNQYQNTRSAGFAGWDAAGKGILILTRFGETSQVHHVAGPGGDRQQLTFTREPIAEADVDPARPGGFFYGQDIGGGEFEQYYFFDRKTGRATLLTDGKSRNNDLLVSRKGGQYAYVSTRRNKKDFDFYIGSSVDGPQGTRLVKEVEGQWHPLDWSPDDTRLLVQKEISINESYLYVMDARSGEMQPINPREGVKISHATGQFTPDGKSVLYTSDEDSEFQRLVRYDLAGGKKTVLTPDVKWDVTKLETSRDGKWLAYTVNEGGASALYLAPLATPAKARRLSVPPGVIGNFDFDPAGKRLAYQLSSAASSSDVFVFDLPAAQKPVQWTQSEVGGLPREVFVTPSLIEYPTFDGKQIPAWIYKPRTTGKKLPVVVLIHGGPESQYQPAFSSLIQYWVNELGVAVVAPNVRGSAGYGKSYLLLDNGFAREDSVKDIGALLDWIAKQPDLDATRVAVDGGSYGGYMVLATITMYPERIRCAVDVVGISNFVTFLEKTESYRRDLRRAEYGDERDPKMREFLTKTAPLTNAAKIKSPLFVVQGANDPRVPINESEQMVQTVRKNGGKVWYLVGKDEGHGFKKKTNVDYYNAATSLFFETHLLK
jgi:dipeptidyl aminopeptidase/acylaminoacyl peptidase